jgi:hypothetical protein
VRVLDLFAGLEGWSAPWRERGHDVFSVDWDRRFRVDLHADVSALTAADLPWQPDVVLASPPCERFTTMQIGRNWLPSGEPRNDQAAAAVELVGATIRLIRELEPAFWVIENPRAILRKLPVIAGLPRRTVTYCQLGMPFMKPTDLWGGFPPSLELPRRATTATPATLELRAAAGQGSKATAATSTVRSSGTERLSRRGGR